MNGRCLAPLFTVVAVVWLAPAGVAGQTQPAAADSWAPSRTPWGEPDLQGVWDYRTITPLQRSPELAGQKFFTKEEAAEFEKRNTGSSLPAFSWWQEKLELTDDRRTSLIVDPPFETNYFFGAVGRNYDVAPDGQLFLVNALVEDSASRAITWVLNWTAELEQ